MTERCPGTNKDGTPCGARPRPGSTFCPWHDPAFNGQRGEWSARGGRNRSKEQRARKALSGGFQDVATAQAVMLRVLARLYKGEFDPGVATAMASVARAINDLAKTGAAASWEEQLAEMRDLAAAIERRGA